MEAMQWNSGEVPQTFYAPILGKPNINQTVMYESSE